MPASQVGVPTLRTPRPDARTGISPELLGRLAAPAGSSLPLPRLLLIFAHPDDEVLAIGARMERLRDSRLLTLTDGAPRDGADARHHGFASLEAYREARREELRCACEDAHLPEEFALAFPEQVADQAASLHLVALARAVAREIREFDPEALLTHPYEGGHPDHDACAFIVRAAVRLVATETEGPTLPVVESPFYSISETGTMKTGAFREASVPILTMPLNPEEQRRKARRIACFRSQTETLAQFSLEDESFRYAPTYGFLTPPHAGELLYERFGWGMEGVRFRALASEALRELFPEQGAQ